MPIWQELQRLDLQVSSFIFYSIGPVSRFKNNRPCNMFSKLSLPPHGRYSVQTSEKGIQSRNPLSKSAFIDLPLQRMQVQAEPIAWLKVP